MIDRQFDAGFQRASAESEQAYLQRDQMTTPMIVGYQVLHANVKGLLSISGEEASWC
jgi:hypothetical protein